MWLNKTYEQIVAGLCGPPFVQQTQYHTYTLPFTLSQPFDFSIDFQELSSRVSQIPSHHTDTYKHSCENDRTFNVRPPLFLPFPFPFPFPKLPISTTRSHVSFANTISTDPAKKGHPLHLLLSHPAGSPNGTPTPRNTISCNSAPGLRNGIHPRTPHPRDLPPKRRRREQNIHMAYRERMEARLMRTRWAVMGPEDLEARMRAVMERGVLE